MTDIKSQSKWIFGAFGAALIAIAVSLYYNRYENVPIAIIVLTAGILLMFQVAWSKLLNRKLDDSDLMSVVALGAGTVLVIGGLGILFFGALPGVITAIVPWALGIVGIFVAARAVMM